MKSAFPKNYDFVINSILRSYFCMSIHSHPIVEVLKVLLKVVGSFAIRLGVPENYGLDINISLFYCFCMSLATSQPLGT